MSVLEAHALTRVVKPFVATSTVNTLAFVPVVDKAAIDAWNQIIDRLIEWGRNPANLADDDAEPPTASAIATAARVASMFRDTQALAPTLVAPNGEGGLSFELRHSNGTDLLVIHADSTVEMICLQNHRVTDRFHIKMA